MKFWGVGRDVDMVKFQFFLLRWGLVSKRGRRSASTQFVWKEQCPFCGELCSLGGIFIMWIMVKKICYILLILELMLLFFRFFKNLEASAIFPQFSLTWSFLLFWIIYVHVWIKVMLCAFNEHYIGSIVPVVIQLLNIQPFLQKKQPKISQFHKYWKTN